MIPDRGARAFIHWDVIGCTDAATPGVSRRSSTTDGTSPISLSQSFADQLVGIQEVSDKIWLVSFMEFDLGYFDEDAARVEPAVNPFSPKVLPM